MIIDLIYGTCLLWFLIKGYSRGLVVALFSVAAIIVGVMAALKLSAAVSALLFGNGGQIGRWAPLVSYILVFLIVAWLIRLGAKFIQKTFELVALGWINRLSGALLYGFLVSFVFSSLLWLFNRVGLIGQDTIDGSLTFSWLEPLAPCVFHILGLIFPFAGRIFEGLSGFFDHINRNIPR